MLHSYLSPHRAQLRFGSRLAFIAVIADGLGRCQSGLRLEGALSRRRSTLQRLVGFVAALALSLIELSAAIPGAPTAVAAVRGAGEAVVSFTAPLSDGGAAITSYTVTASPSELTATGASSPITITGLTNGTSYTFTVTATNSDGAGSASSASSAITPTAGSLAGVTFSNTGSGSSAEVKATAVDAAGNIYLAGYFNYGDATSFSIGGVTLTKIGLEDAWVAKLDSTRTVVWAKNFGGNGASTRGNGIAVDTAGNVYLGGSFDSANLTTTTPGQEFWR